MCFFKNKGATFIETDCTITKPDLNKRIEDVLEIIASWFDLFKKFPNIYNLKIENLLKDTYIILWFIQALTSTALILLRRKSCK